MHFLIIWQSDEKVRPIFQPLIDAGADAGVIESGGNHWRTFEMPSWSYPRGLSINPVLIFNIIVQTAAHALQVAERAAEMQVMFVFHQTSSKAVRGIMGALQMLAPDVLDALAASNNKDLIVPQVVLLSCESGMDKTTPNPVPPGWQKWVDQARNMREACFQAFTIRSPTSNADYPPRVITFSTGDPETGGVGLHPWQARFFALHGSFAADGNWDYDLDANGDPDHSMDPSGGTVFADLPPGAGAATTHDIASGAAIPPLLPPFP